MSVELQWNLSSVFIGEVCLFGICNVTNRVFGTVKCVLFTRCPYFRVSIGKHMVGWEKPVIHPYLALHPGSPFSCTIMYV